MVHLIIPAIPTDVTEHLRREHEVEAFFIGHGSNREGRLALLAAAATGDTYTRAGGTVIEGCLKFLLQSYSLLRRLSDSARVRLAAKAALADRGVATPARVEELAQLRSALLRDAHGAEDAEAIMELREQAAHQLAQLAAAGTRLKYAVDRALRR
ncbi:ECE2 [Symbiodinium natans]|uniref:ECE2 protein n=1 Tax=Symbiodinium natans TaxID=878477 RepID=A0A812PJ27_9DINO|nr:ECE2 [Symbiodinium natans]